MHSILPIAELSENRVSTTPGNPGNTGNYWNLKTLLEIL